MVFSQKAVQRGALCVWAAVKPLTTEEGLFRYGWRATAMCDKKLIEVTAASAAFVFNVMPVDHCAPPPTPRTRPSNTPSDSPNPRAERPQSSFAKFGA